MLFRKRAINTNKYKDSNTQKNKKIKTMHTCSVLRFFFCFCVLQASAKASTKHETSAERESYEVGLFSRPNPIASDSLRACLVQTDKQTNKQNACSAGKSKWLFCIQCMLIVLVAMVISNSLFLRRFHLSLKIDTRKNYINWVG